MSVNEQTATSERQAFSSVEITKNTKGYSWAVKVYAPAGDEMVALTKAKALNEALKAEYEPDVTPDAWKSDSDG